MVKINVYYKIALLFNLKRHVFYGTVKCVYNIVQVTYIKFAVVFIITMELSHAIN